MRISDWSSDVCSSDLEYQGRGAGFVLQACLHLTAWKNGIRTFYYDVASDNDRIIRHLKLLGATHAGRADNIDRLELPVYRRARDVPDGTDIGRRFPDVFVRLQGMSEERRVGKECWSTCRSR